ncbi:MAG: RES family NAD+ phosphorylase [Actinomycetota bacterium]
MYRAARRTPWWFCTCGECRFDLSPDDPSGLGTLYAGTDPVTGVVEMIGPESSHRPISRTFLASRTIWTLGYNRAMDVADLQHPSALGFGVTNELASMVPYDVPQMWATALAAQSLDGLRYRTRFSTGPVATGLAIFDEAGSKDWIALAYCRADDDEILAELDDRGIQVVDVPLSASMEILE